MFSGTGSPISWLEMVYDEDLSSKMTIYGYPKGVILETKVNTRLQSLLDALNVTNCFLAYSEIYLELSQT